MSDDYVSDLESEVSRLSDDLAIQADQIKSLEEKAVPMKVSFADHVLSLQKPAILVLRSHLFLVSLFLVHRMHLWPAATFLVQMSWPSVLTFLHLP